MSNTKLILLVVGIICLLVFIGLFFGGINLAFLFDHILLITFVIFLMLLRKKETKNNVKSILPKAIGLAFIAWITLVVIWMFVIFLYYYTK